MIWNDGSVSGFLMARTKRLTPIVVRQGERHCSLVINPYVFRQCLGFEGKETQPYPDGVNLELFLFDSVVRERNPTVVVSVAGIGPNREIEIDTDVGPLNRAALFVDKSN